MYAPAPSPCFFPVYAELLTLGFTHARTDRAHYKTFGLERLLAIFYTLVVHPVDASAELLAEISGLVSLGLVRKVPPSCLHPRLIFRKHPPSTLCGSLHQSMPSAASLPDCLPVYLSLRSGASKLSLHDRAQPPAYCLKTLTMPPPTPTFSSCSYATHPPGAPLSFLSSSVLPVFFVFPGLCACQIGNGDQLADCKFACRASYSMVQAVAASVRVELARFLHHDS